MKFRITMTTLADVSTAVLVQANTELEAKAKALSLAKEGNAMWIYDGADDSTVEVATVEDIEEESE